MRRNFEITIQVSFETNLSDEELKANIQTSATKHMLNVENAEPIGLYLVTIEEKSMFNFPKPPSDDKLSDRQMERKREVERLLKEEEKWRDQETMP